VAHRPKGSMAQHIGHVPPISGLVHLHRGEAAALRPRPALQALGHAAAAGPGAADPLEDAETEVRLLMLLLVMLTLLMPALLRLPLGPPCQQGAALSPAAPPQRLRGSGMSWRSGSCPPRP